MFKTVGLFGKYQDKTISQPLKKLADHLDSKGIFVKIGNTTAEEIIRDLPPERLITELSHEIDLAIVIGGDGTLLHVARTMAETEVPIIGVNLGRLGFLTDITLDNMLDEIDLILKGDFRLEKRNMLHVEVSRGDEIVYQQIALNDIVIGKHALDKLISWRAEFDGQFVTSARSDGVIIATPTGSTAYALSAGGPIVHPGMDVVTLVPVSPHTLSNRPITLPASAKIEFSILNQTPNTAHVSADGLIGHQLKGDEKITISKARHSVTLVHTSHYDYFAMLRLKLGWGGA